MLQSSKSVYSKSKDHRRKPSKFLYCKMAKKCREKKMNGNERESVRKW